MLSKNWNNELRVELDLINKKQTSLCGALKGVTKGFVDRFVVLEDMIQYYERAHL